MKDKVTSLRAQLQSKEESLQILKYTKQPSSHSASQGVYIDELQELDSEYTRGVNYTTQVF